MGIAGRDEACIGRAQHELVQLSVCALDTNTSTIIVNLDDGALLDAAAEVLDAR
jgi:hypothetical protein